MTILVSAAVGAALASAFILVDTLRRRAEHRIAVRLGQRFSKARAKR